MRVPDGGVVTTELPNESVYVVGGIFVPPPDGRPAGTLFATCPGAVVALTGSPAYGVEDTCCCGLGGQSG